MGAKTWKLAGIEKTEEIKKMQRELGLPRPIAVYFAARGIDIKSVGDFLSPKLGNLSDPYRFPGIQDAAKRASAWQPGSR